MPSTVGPSGFPEHPVLGPTCRIWRALSQPITAPGRRKRRSRRRSIARPTARHPLRSDKPKTTRSGQVANSRKWASSLGRRPVRAKARPRSSKHPARCQDHPHPPGSAAKTPTLTRIVPASPQHPVNVGCHARRGLAGNLPFQRSACATTKRLLAPMAPATRPSATSPRSRWGQAEDHPPLALS